LRSFWVGLKPTIVHFSGHGACTSLATAGVLPRLARGVTGLGPFVVREFRPGEQPAARLGQAFDVPAGEPLVILDWIAALLAHRGPSASLLIVVDQLEELFTLATADERAPFLDALRALREEPLHCGVHVARGLGTFGARSRHSGGSAPSARLLDEKRR
jgi:hypothetical protein